MSKELVFNIFCFVYIFMIPFAAGLLSGRYLYPKQDKPNKNNFNLDALTDAEKVKLDTLMSKLDFHDANYVMTAVMKATACVDKSADLEQLSRAISESILEARKKKEIN